MHMHKMINIYKPQQQVVRQSWSRESTEQEGAAEAQSGAGGGLRFWFKQLMSHKHTELTALNLSYLKRPVGGLQRFYC